MNKPEQLSSDEERRAQPVFISYATADRKQALKVCQALERRGATCWISTRDVAPGENYQEAIVRAIRGARAMVLVFSEAANNSDEIKKELSLASRHHVPLMALRIEDVEPSDAFAYEFSTRQWIDAFEGWDSSLDALVRKLEQISAVEVAAPPPRAARSKVRASALPMKTLILTGTVLLIVLASLAAWVLMRPRGADAPPMQVRLTSFDRLSTDLPASLPNAFRDEIIAAFAKDGQVSVSTASPPPTGTAPVYALGGSIGLEGGMVRVIARVTNERTGTLIWSNNFLYEKGDNYLDHLPYWFAVDASEVIKCGLFNASTYPNTLPEQALSILFKICGQQSNIDYFDSGPDMLSSARKLVHLVPDFSAAWSNLALVALDNASQVPSGQQAALMKEATEAAARAIRLDRKNSQAYLVQSYILPHGDLVGREALLKRAIAARPLACGCEHSSYGRLLWEVGRTEDAFAEFRRALDIAPLPQANQLSYAEILMILGRPDEAQMHFQFVGDASSPFESDEFLKVKLAPMTGDYAAAQKVLKANRVRLGSSPVDQSAFVAAFDATISGNSAAKAKAAVDLAALKDYRDEISVTMLGALGANRLALDQLEYLAASRYLDPVPRTLLWYPSMAGAVRDPYFPAVAQRLGMMRYWKTTHTRPDVCAAKEAPPFCRMI